jgi:hypothetical protein
MRFYVSNRPTGVLHVSRGCSPLQREGRTTREATLTEIAEAYTMCGMCTKHQTGKEKP